MIVGVVVCEFWVVVDAVGVVIDEDAVMIGGVGVVIDGEGVMRLSGVTVLCAIVLVRIAGDGVIKFCTFAL